MAILSVQDEFQSGDNVTATNLNNLVNQANFVDGASQTTDDSTLEVHTAGYLKVKNNGVGDEHLQQMTDAQVTTAGNENGRAVTTDHIRNDAVTNAKIANLAVDTAQIAADAVEYSKMQNVAANSVIGNTTNSAANPTDVSMSTLAENLKDDIVTEIGNAAAHTSDTDSDGTNDTGGTDGLLSATDKTKLDGIATSANNYLLPVATNTIGGVREGGDIDIDANGVMTLNSSSLGSWQNASNQSSYSTYYKGVHTYTVPTHIPTSATELMLQFNSGEGTTYFWNYWSWEKVHDGVNNGTAVSYVTIPLRERYYGGSFLTTRQLKFYVVNAPGDDNNAFVQVRTYRYKG